MSQVTSYKKGYIEVCPNDIQAVVVKVYKNEELQDIEEEIKRFGGFTNIDEAEQFLKEIKCKEIEVQK